MMPAQYSIAEARHNLARLVHQVEQGTHVELTRRGKPVAVVIPMGEYSRQVKGITGFWQAVEDFRRDVDLKRLGVNPSLVFQGARDRSTGREVNL